MSDVLLSAISAVQFPNAEQVPEGTLCEAQDDGSLYRAVDGIWEPLTRGREEVDDARALTAWLSRCADATDLTAFYFCEGTIAGGESYAWYACVLLAQSKVERTRTFTLRATTAPALANKMERVGLEPVEWQDVACLCESAGANPRLRKPRKRRP